MPAIKIDLSKLLGYRLLGDDAAPSAMIGEKVGSKIGMKDGLKVGMKVGMKLPADGN